MGIPREEVASPAESGSLSGRGPKEVGTLDPADRVPAVDGACAMICRLWRGWTTPENAPAYERIVRGEVIPEIEARGIPGLLSIDLMRRSVEDGFEFATLMWFDDLGAVKGFVGDDYELAHVPERARTVLSRFDERSAHFEVIDRRDQSPS